MLCMVQVEDNGSGSRGGMSGILGQDPIWKLYSLVEGNINETICNYCRLLMGSGGITRFKFHLVHTHLHNNTKKCPRVPFEVKEKIQEM